MVDLIKGFRRNYTAPSISCVGDPLLTHAGQAHFAGGAAGFCGDCSYHQKETPKSRGKICTKARQLGQSKSPVVPDGAMACKYYEPEALVSSGRDDRAVD